MTVSNDNYHWGGEHSRGSGKGLREREAEGDTVPVRSNPCIHEAPLVPELASQGCASVGRLSSHLPSEGLSHKTGLPAAAHAEATAGLRHRHAGCQHTHHTHSPRQ